jgi:uncharacterized protein (DUF58 family)
MHATRGCWTLLGVGGVLALLSVVLESSLYVIGAIGVWAWVLVEQLRFARNVRTVTQDVTVTQTVSPGVARTGQPVIVTIELESTDPIHGLTTLEVTAPLAATHLDGTERLGVETTAAAHQLSATYEFDVTGPFEFDPPRVALESPRGLFTERAPVGSTAGVRVEPNAPTDVAVGEQGNRISLGVGEHDAEIGSGAITLGETRPYVAGDPQSRIDWKTTARQGEPYVREYEAASSLETLLFVDHRSSTSVGADGRRALDYLRSVGLWVVDNAATLGDPLGCYTIGDDGLTGRTQPTAETAHYEYLRTTLHDLEPTQERARGLASVEVREMQSRPDGQPQPGGHSQLGSDSAFERTLSAYTTHGRGYVERVTEQSLFRSIQSTVSRTPGNPWIVVLTTDTDPTEVLETVRGIRQGVAHVTVFVAPTALFETDSLGDLDALYDSYQAFEGFRTKLVSEHVDAYEVVPGERVDALLARTAAQREVSR